MSETGSRSESARPVGTGDACRILGVSRSTLYRWERLGRIRRAATVAGRPLWDLAEVTDPVLPEATDKPDGEPEFDRLAAELRTLVEAGDDALSDSRSLRLLEQMMRRRLAVRTLQGDAVAVGELGELMRLDLRIRHLESFERAQVLTSGR
jgi:hypothetical protein